MNRCTMERLKSVWLIPMVCFIVGTILSAAAWADPMDELLDQYDESFKSVVPPAHSSVHSDYKFDQIAMGGQYTAKSIRLLYQQNQSLVNRQAEANEKYDQIIEQNKEIIRLLKIIAKQKGE